MKKQSKFLFSIVGLLACVSTSSPPPSKKTISFSDLRVIELGKTSEQIKNIFGSPDYIENRDEDHKKYIWWIYYSDLNKKDERLLLEFDQTSKALLSKWVFPHQSENEAVLAYWEDSLSKNRIELRRCKRHWSEISYANLEKNIVVQSKEGKSGVDAVGWLSPERMKSYQEIFKKSCPKPTSVK